MSILHFPSQAAEFTLIGLLPEAEQLLMKEKQEI